MPGSTCATRLLMSSVASSRSWRSTYPAGRPRGPPRSASALGADGVRVSPGEVRREVGALAAGADPAGVLGRGARSSSPVASAIQVAASISTTAGGVPRVCRTPGDHLDGGVRRHPHLDRLAGRARPRAARGSAWSAAAGRRRRRLAGVEPGAGVGDLGGVGGAQAGGHRGILGLRRRPRPRVLCGAVAPASSAAATAAASGTRAAGRCGAARRARPGCAAPSAGSRRRSSPASSPASSLVSRIACSVTARSVSSSRSVAYAASTMPVRPWRSRCAAKTGDGGLAARRSSSSRRLTPHAALVGQPPDPVALVAGLARAPPRPGRTSRAGAGGSSPGWPGSPSSRATSAARIGRPAASSRRGSGCGPGARSRAAPAGRASLGSGRSSAHGAQS